MSIFLLKRMDGYRHEVDVPLIQSMKNIDNGAESIHK